MSSRSISQNQNRATHALSESPIVTPRASMIQNQNGTTALSTPSKRSSIHQMILQSQLATVAAPAASGQITTTASSPLNAQQQPLPIDQLDLPPSAILTSVSTTNHSNTTSADDVPILDPNDYSLGYVKSLQSDLSEAESLMLLQRVQLTDSLFQGFDATELELLSSVLSVLHFQEGDKIISKGEAATFCGVVLNGTFSVIVSSTMSVPLTAGHMIGEMSYFEGGVRNSDCVAATDAVLAVITFTELDALQATAPRLQNKLIRMFAQASLAKARVTAAQGGRELGLTNTSTAVPLSLPSSSTPPSTAVPILTSPLSTPSKKGSISFTPSTNPLQHQAAVREVESLYRGRLAKQRLNAKMAIEQEKQSRLLAEKQHDRSQVLMGGLQQKVSSLVKELDELKREHQGLKVSHEQEQRIAQRTIVTLQEENARWKIKYNSEVISRQGTEDQLSDVLQNMQQRHLKAVAQLRQGARMSVGANDNGAATTDGHTYDDATDALEDDPEEPRLNPMKRSILLTDDSNEGATPPALTRPGSVAKSSGVGRDLLKRQFRQLTKLAVKEKQHEQMKEHAREVTKVQVSLKQSNTDLLEKLRVAEAKLQTLDALKESSFQASCSYELNRKRLLSKFDLANMKIKDQKLEIQHLKLLLRTVVCTRALKDFKTKRNLIAMISKLSDMFLYQLERIHAIVPQTFQTFLLTTEETENSNVFGSNGNQSTTLNHFNETKVSTQNTLTQPSSTGLTSSNPPSTPAAVSFPTAPTSVSSSTSVMPFKPGVPIPFPPPTTAASSSTPYAYELPLMTTGAVRTPLESLALLHDTKKTALRELIHKKARTSHAELISTMDLELEKLQKISTQTLHTLTYYHELSKKFSERIGELTNEKSEHQLLLNDLMLRWVSLRNAQELRNREQQELEAHEQEQTTLKKEETSRLETHLRQLQSKIEQAKRKKTELEADIVERLELSKQLVKQYIGRQDELRMVLGEIQDSRAIYPHYATMEEESKMMDEDAYDFTSSLASNNKSKKRNKMYPVLIPHSGSQMLLLNSGSTQTLGSATISPFRSPTASTANFHSTATLNGTLTTSPDASASTTSLFQPISIAPVPQSELASSQSAAPLLISQPASDSASSVPPTPRIGLPIIHSPHTSISQSLGDDSSHTNDATPVHPSTARSASTHLPPTANSTAMASPPPKRPHTMSNGRRRIGVKSPAAQYAHLDPISRMNWQLSSLVPIPAVNDTSTIDGSLHGRMNAFHAPATPLLRFPTSHSTKRRSPGVKQHVSLSGLESIYGK